MEILGKPDRIVYIANVDTEIDLGGLVIVDTTADGFVWNVWLGDVIVWETDSGPVSVDYMPGLSVHHEVDFTKPGVYEVEVHQAWGEWGGADAQNRDKVTT
jgi:hypothetical protein